MASAIGIPPPYCALKTVAGSNKGASSVDRGNEIVGGSGSCPGRCINESGRGVETIKGDKWH